ncbi:MAG: DUF342 domain-containing protein [Peptococcia bacterium]|jgi:uncharacterized protein (DUF342 family)
MYDFKKTYQLQKGEGIYLTVKNDVNVSFPVKLENLYYELAQRKISYDPHFIKKCFQEATGKKEQIAPLQAGQIYKTLLEVQVSADKMEAVLKVYPSLDGTLLELKAFEQFLSAKGIKFGLKTEIFPEVVKMQSNYCEWLIAEGKSSVNGENGSLQFHFQKGEHDLKPKVLENGGVDFYDLNLIQIVAAGTTLVERIPPTEGIKGRNVLGEDIKAKPGKDVRLPLGVNTEIVDDETKLISKIDGHISYVNKKVNVYPTYEVKGNVDFNTGNIKFPGNVIVRGSVINTFTVEAGGDVEIYGNLGGTVIAEGNLHIRKGIIQGEVKVKGSIYVRYIENGSAFSKEDIFVGEAIMHSTIKAGKKLSVSGKRGLIVGGHISVGEEVSAKNIGSPMGTSTILEVGYVPELIDEYKVVCTHLKHCQENKEKNDKILNSFEKMKATGNFTSGKNKLYLKVWETQYQNEKEIEKLQKQKNLLELQFGDISEARIKVQDTIYSGVVLNMGKHTLHILEEKYRVVFRLEDYEIRGFNL